MNKKISAQFLLSVCCVVVLSGCCGRRISIKTTAYSDVHALPCGFRMDKSFRLEGGSTVDGVKQHVDELEVKELAQKISVMLVNRGYRVTHDASADYCLRFNYGRKKGTESYQELKYIPGKTYKTNTTVIGTSGLNNYDQTTTAPGQFVFVPKYYSVFTKFLDFRVYDKKGWEQSKNEKAPSQHIWYGSASGTDQYDDMRTYVDYLLVSLFGMFGGNGNRETTVCEDNKSVTSLREQMWS